MLSKEQVKILAWVATGATDDEIAGKLRMTPIEIKTEIDAIFKKIHVPDRLQATLWVAKNFDSATND